MIDYYTLGVEVCGGDAGTGGAPSVETEDVVRARAAERAKVQIAAEKAAAKLAPKKVMRFDPMVITADPPAKPLDPYADVKPDAALARAQPDAHAPARAQPDAPGAAAPASAVDWSAVFSAPWWRVALGVAAAAAIGLGIWLGTRRGAAPGAAPAASVG